MRTGASGMGVKGSCLVYQGVDANETIQQRNITVLAFAGSLTMEQRGNNGTEGIQATNIIANHGTALGGAAVLLAGNIH